MMLSTILVYQKYQWTIMPRFIPIVAFILGLLMVSKIPYMSLKKARLEQKHPFNSLVAVVLAIGLLVMLSEFHEIVIFSIFVIYTLLGIATQLRIPVWKLPGVGYYIPVPTDIHKDTLPV